MSRVSTIQECVEPDLFSTLTSGRCLRKKDLTTLDKLSLQLDEITNDEINAVKIKYAERLTTREAIIIASLLEGYSPTELSMLLNISIKTISSHERNAYLKLGIKTTQQLFRLHMLWERAI
ncbi:helix-turn-helix domain-containing protein [Serratia marcescens]|uniref:helix-turn-helix domain-containing protein n=1 Tax=Serratia marcescens TaxID=615 RepID=UPI0009413060|nr:helix-turn-helix transcriptional regulator [Serratia marcescens]